MERDLDKAWLLWLTVLAAALRLYTLSIEAFWYDEAFTAWLAGMPWADLVAATAGDVHPPTWYAIEKLAVASLGNSEFSLRLVSALAGVALVPVLYFVAIRLDYAPKTAVWAAALAATAPNTVYYSQEARPYSLILLCAACSLLFLLDKRPVYLFVAATGLLYLHNLAVFTAAALGWLALYRHNYRAASALLLAAAAWLPWVIWGLLPQLHEVSNGFWVQPPTLGAPFYAIYTMLFSATGALLALAAAPLLVVGLWLGWPLFPQGTRPQLLGLLLLPVFALAIVSMLATPVLIPRVVISGAIPLILWLAPVMNRYRAYTAATMALFAVFMVMYWGLPQFGRLPFNDGPISREWQQGDAIYHASVSTYITWRYHLPTAPQYVWPQANDLSQNLTQRTKKAMQIAQAGVSEIACRHGRVWVAFMENPLTSSGERAEIARLQADYGAELVDTPQQGFGYKATIYRIDEPCQQQAAQ